MDDIDRTTPQNNLEESNLAKEINEQIPYSEQEIHQEMEAAEKEIQDYKDKLKEDADKEIQNYKDSLKEDAEKEIQDYKDNLKEDADKEIQSYKDKETSALIEIVKEKKQEKLDLAEREVHDFKKTRRLEIDGELEKYKTDEYSRINREIEEYKRTIEDQYKSESEEKWNDYFRRLRLDADVDIALYRKEQMERIDKFCVSKENLWKKRIREENMEHFYRSQKENAQKILEIHRQMVSVDRLVSSFKEELFWNNMNRVFEQFRLIYNDISYTKNGYIACTDYKENPYLQNIVDNLNHTLELIDDCMQDVGIYSYESKQGDLINALKHESSQSDGRIIKKSLRKGFEYRDIEGNHLKVLQKELVETER